ncbi:MAG: oligosaccharide flippase family protein [Bacteroidota bacterium]
MPGTDAPAIPMPERIPLKRRVLTASAWTLAGYGISQVLRFGSNLIMTRLLVPEMFGVMAIATIVMVGLAMFSDLGLRQNIVQSRRGADPLFLNTAWVLQILRGLVLWVIALAISVIIFVAARAGMVPPDSVYAHPSLPWVVAVLSFGAVIGGFESTKTSEASRNLALGRITQLDLVTQIVGLLCMLAWASFDRSIWALVAGGILAGMLRTALTHVWLPGNANRWQWDRPALLELVHFGKWIFLSSILGFLVNSGDRLLLGWMVDGTVLGVYVIAFSMYSAIEQVMSRIIGSVGFPALSEVVRNKGDLKAAYYRFHGIIAATAYFCAGALMTSGEALIGVLYDHRYAQAGWMLQILAVGLMALPFQIAVQCYMALGMPRIVSIIIVVRLLALLVLTPVGFQFLGVAGAIWGIVLSQLSYVPSIIYFSRKSDLIDVSKEMLLLPTILLGMAGGKILAVAIGYAP